MAHQNKGAGLFRLLSSVPLQDSDANPRAELREQHAEDRQRLNRHGARFLDINVVMAI
jgi:hypothetical protein